MGVSSLFFVLCSGPKQETRRGDECPMPPPALPPLSSPSDPTYLRSNANENYARTRHERGANPTSRRRRLYHIQIRNIARTNSGTPPPPYRRRRLLLPHKAYKRFLHSIVVGCRQPPCLALNRRDNTTQVNRIEQSSAQRNTRHTTHNTQHSTDNTQHYETELN